MEQRILWPYSNPDAVYVPSVPHRMENNMGMFLVSLLAPLTYLHIGGATLIVLNQPPLVTVRRPAPTHRTPLGTVRRPAPTHRTPQGFVEQQLRPADNVFGLDSRSLRWPGSAGRRGDVTFTRQSPTQVWIPEPPGQLTQWPQGHVTQSEWIPIESIPKSNNPSEWIRKQDVPPPKLYKPEVKTVNKIPRRKIPEMNKPAKTKRKKTFPSKTTRKRKISDYEALNLMEEYVNKRLALEQSRNLETERTKTAVSTPPSTTIVPGPAEALPPALDFLSGRQFVVPAESKRDNTLIQNSFADLQDLPDMQPSKSVHPTDAPSLVPIPDNLESIDLFSNAFKALTDVFSLTEASSYSDATTSPSSDNRKLQNITDTSTTVIHGDASLSLGHGHDETVSLTDTLIQEVLSSVFSEGGADTTSDPISTGHSNINNMTTQEIKPLTQAEELPMGDNQTISEMPTYTLEKESVNHKLKTEAVTTAAEVEISTQKSTLREKSMAHSLDTLKEVTRILDPPRQIPSPPLEQNVLYESTTSHVPLRERLPHYDIFRGQRKQQDVDNLDLFSSEPPVEQNHPFSKGFKSSRYQQFEMRGKQINTNRDILHREPPYDHSNTQTFEQTSYYQKQQPPYYDRQNDVRYLEPYENRNHYQENTQNTFNRRKPRQWKITKVEISTPTNSGWESQTSSPYGIDPSETRHHQYHQTVVEHQSFERRRKPTRDNRQPLGQAPSQSSHPTWSRTTWYDSNKAPESPYGNGADRHTPNQDPYATDYVRRNRPTLSHFEKSGVVGTGQEHDLVSNQGSRSPLVYTAIEHTTPLTTTEDPPTESVPEFRSNNEIGSSQSWPQRQSSGRTWEGYPAASQSTGWARTESNSHGWERRDGGRTNSWQHSSPTQTDVWARHDTGYDVQGEYNTQNEVYGNNQQNEYGQENTQYSYTELSEYSNTDNTGYNTHEGYNNEAQTIDYTDGEGNGGDDDSDEDDR